MSPTWESRIPATPGSIERPRLLSLLHSATQDYRVTLISAPPGYGKSTLAAHFARHSKAPVAWQTIEDRARDYPELASEAMAALAAAIPNISNFAISSGDGPQELAGRITDLLRSVVRSKLIYILDDVQRLSGAGGAEMWLRTLVSRLPPTCHLILISRTLPSLPFAEMVARKEVFAIGVDQLRMTTEEVAQLATRIDPSQVSLEKIHDVSARLEGWPAGVFLALQPLPSSLERAMLEGGEGPGALFDILATSMLEAQPSNLRQFLLSASTLPRLSTALCESVLQLDDAAIMLREVQERNLFLMQTSGGLVLHGLFREFLQRLFRTQAPDQFHALHRRAAEWFAGRDDNEQAFEHFMAAGMVKEARELAEANAALFEAEDRTETMLNWRQRLREAGQPAGRLAFHCAKIYLRRYQYEHAELALNESQVHFQNLNDSIALQSIELLRSSIYVQQGQYREALDHALPLTNVASTSVNLRGRALRIVGFAEFNLGQTEAGIQRLEEAIPLYRTDGDLHSLAQLLLDLQVAYTQVGRLREAGKCLHEIVAIRRAIGQSGALAMALNNLGCYFHQCSDYDQAQRTFAEGLSIVTRISDTRAETYLLWSSADLERDLGNYDQAQSQYLRTLEILGGSEPYVRSKVLSSLSIMKRWQGRYQEAVALAEEAAGIAQSLSSVAATSAAETALWAARAHLGSPTDCVSGLEQTLKSLAAQKLWFYLTGSLVTAAAVDRLCGNLEPAEEKLNRAMQLVDQVGSAQLTAAEVMHNPDLEAIVAAKPSLSPLLRRDINLLREAQRRAQHRARVHATALPAGHNLTVLTMGQEVVERDGHPIRPSEWRAAAARDLFYFLLFQGPATREQVCLEFWPDHGPQQVRQTFHTTLYRARQALGDEAIIFKDDKYQVNQDIDLWCDAHEIRALAQRARVLSVHDPRTEDLWTRVVERNQGEFLPSSFLAWVDTMREQLFETRLEALHALGECARARADLRSALEWFKRILMQDPYREQAHRSILVCYSELGEKQQVALHFATMKRMFEHELNISLSDETLHLADSLLS